MSRDTLYFGRAGQMAVVSEFLCRGWNVAIPEVDIGDDAFVIRDSDFLAYRIQVKSGRLSGRGPARSAQFRIPLRQLQRPHQPELYYVFAARAADRWAHFVVVGRLELESYWLGHEIGEEGRRGDALHLRMVYDGAHARWGDIDFTQYLNNWSPWPIVQH